MPELLTGGTLQGLRAHGFHATTPTRRRISVRKVCAGCERQRALFRYHGIVKWDRYHALCFRCFRAQVDALRG